MTAQVPGLPYLRSCCVMSATEEKNNSTCRREEGLSYIGAREQKRAEDQLKVAKEFGTQVKGTNSSQSQLYRLRHVL